MLVFLRGASVWGTSVCITAGFSTKAAGKAPGMGPPAQRHLPAVAVLLLAARFTIAVSERQCAERDVDLAHAALVWGGQNQKNGPPQLCSVYRRVCFDQASGRALAGQRAYSWIPSAMATRLATAGNTLS